MLAGAGIRQGAKNQKKAQEFLKWLTSEKVQKHFANQNFEYPTKPGIDTHPAVKALSNDQLAPVAQKSLADMGPTRKLIKELGLQ